MSEKELLKKMNNKLKETEHKARIICINYENEHMEVLITDQWKSGVAYFHIAFHDNVLFIFDGVNLGAPLEFSIVYNALDKLK